jgi:hypothetical protein
MRTFYTALGISALAAVAFAVSFYLGVDWYRDKRALDDAQTHIENRERIDDAIAPVDGCFWLDRLRAACGD